MEGAWITLILLCLAGCLSGPVLGTLALVRTRGLKRSMRRLAQLESDVAMLRRTAKTPAGTSRPAPEPAAPTAGTAVVPTATARPVVRRQRPAPSAPPARSLEWERWIGIRGAAVLGGVALSLAGLLFFKYTIEQGLISPALRVALAAIAGSGCIAGSLVLRSRGYRYAADGVAGAGIVILYSAFWAAHVLYGLIGMVPAFALMILVTTACCLLSLRGASMLVAVLGLIGGFATPLLLSSGVDRPLGLFGYVLLLDLGLLTLGAKRGWPALGLLSLGGTFLLEGLWMGRNMGPDRLLLGLGMLAVVALVYTTAGALVDPRSRRAGWAWSQASAILFPFAFALHFAAHVDLAPRLVPIAVLLGVLSLAACWLAKRRRWPGLAVAAAAADVGVVGAWLLRHTAASSWELIAVVGGLTLVLHLFGWLDGDRRGANLGGLVGSIGFFILLLAAAASASGVPPWPWIVAWSGLAAILYAEGSGAGRAALQLLAAAGLGTGLSLLHLRHFHDPSFPAATTYLASIVAAALIAHAVGLIRRDGVVRTWAYRAAAVLPLLSLLLLSGSPLLRSLGPWSALLFPLALGLIGVQAATRLGSGAWYGAAVVTTALAHASWSFTTGLATHTADAKAALLVQFAAVILFTGRLFLGSTPLAGERLGRYAAALAGPLWFLPMKAMFEQAFGDAAIGLLPLALGAIAVAATFAAHGIDLPDAERRATLAWFWAVGLGFVAVAIPLQLEREWITVAWALYALSLLGLGLFRRVQGLRWASLALLMASIVRAFLHDLGHLQDLYRVGSLVGLAVSLITVSLLYQRFVLGDGRETPQNAG